MKQDKLYRWFIKMYGEQAKTQIRVAERRGADPQDVLLSWFDHHFSDIALVLLIKYGMEFIAGVLEDVSA